MGAWFTPPVDYDEMAERIGLNERYEEYAIHDYELPFEIDEYTPIEEVNRLCEMVEDLPEDRILANYIQGNTIIQNALSLTQSMFRLPVQEYIAVPKLPFLFLEFREHFF